MAALVYETSVVDGTQRLIRNQLRFSDHYSSVHAFRRREDIPPANGVEAGVGRDSDISVAGRRGRRFAESHVPVHIGRIGIACVGIIRVVRLGRSDWIKFIQGTITSAAAERDVAIKNAAEIYSYTDQQQHDGEHNGGFYQRCTTSTAT